MKSKLSMKLLGVVVTFATIASLLVGITAPVSAAAPGTLAWAVTASPSAVGKFLSTGIGVNRIDVAADGKTVFAWDETAKKMYKSTNAGASWDAGTAIATTAAIVGIHASPNFATDGAVVVITAAEVFFSTNGGATYSSVILDLTAKLEGGTITSLDVGSFFSSPGALSIILGVSGGAGLISNTLMWTQGGFAWTPVGDMSPTGTGIAVAPLLAFDPAVKAVMFSPSHATDAEIMAIYVDTVNTTLGPPATTGRTFLSSHYGATTLAWNAFIPALQIVASGTTSGAAIGVGNDYVGNTGSAILVSLFGTGIAAPADNIYKVTGRSAGTGAASNLKVAGDTTNVSAQQIVVSGTAAAGTVFWTTVGSPTVKRATGGTATFTVAGPSTQPIGATQAWLSVNGGTTLFASVSGIDGGVSRSLDGGVSFQGVGLIDVGTIANMSYIDLNVVDVNTMFLTMNNATGGYTARSVFKTTDAGATWVRIRASAGAVKVITSPSYASDSTLVVLEGTTLTLKSTNGGATFTAYGIPTNAVTGVMVDANNFFAGGGTAGELFKSGRFAAATFPAGFAALITSVAVNPKDATKATIAVGCNDASVYWSTNDGVTFTKVTGATVNPTGANAMVAYGPDGTLYCATTTGFGSYNGTDWVALGGTNNTNIALSGDATLYASSTTTTAVVYRSVKPTATSAAKAEVQTLGGGVAATDVHVISGAAANSIYVLDNAVAQANYGFAGGIYGYSDTLIAASTITAPVNATVLTDTTITTLSWPAVAGATSYQLSIDGGDFTTVGNVTKWNIGDGAVPFNTIALAQGSTHTWSVRADLPLYNRASTSASFTMALVQPAVNTVQSPTQGATNVPIDTTFAWPASVAAGATYEFVIAEELGNVDKFAIIDYSATCPTNATPLRETLKYSTVYWWRVRTVTGTSKSAWTVSFFTTAAAPVVTSSTTPIPPVTITTTNFTVTQPPATTITISNPPATQAPPAIPSYLLWAVIAVGAILVIAVIVLIVRTRKI